MAVQTTAFDVLDAVTDVCGVLRRPLRPDKLVETARRRTGLRDFGGVDVAEPLQRFLESCRNEAALGLVGRMATRWDVLRFLCNLLRLRPAEQAAPRLLDERIDRPVFITGLPRSVTTFLHRIMITDPANRAPLVWRTIYPYPAKLRRRDTRPARAARQLRAFERLAQDFRDVHPLRADSPQECSEITARVFRNLRFDTIYRIPSYRAWLDSDTEGHLPAYRFHRRFLQHLQYQGRQPLNARWVQKCPDHLFALDTIRSVCPDARLVFVHRDPLKVLLSVAKLTEALRPPLRATSTGRRSAARRVPVRWRARVA